MTNKVIFVAIAGASASGKTLLADNVIKELRCRHGTDVALISEDNYYKDLSHLPPETRAKFNFDHPDAFDHELLMEHLDRIGRGQAIEMPTYDYIDNVRLRQVSHIAPAKIVIVEGIMLLVNDGVRDKMDIKIYVDTPLDLCIVRRIERDVIQRGRSISSVIAQYKATVRPMFMQFIEPSKKYADLIVPRGGKNHIAVRLISTLLEKCLIAEGGGEGIKARSPGDAQTQEAADEMYL